RATWQARDRSGDFEHAWRQALHDGIVPDTALPVKSVTVRSEAFARPPSRAGGLELVFRPSPAVLDGRFANNGWLQELPQPLTKLTWDNAALVSPATAARLHLADEDVVELRRARVGVRAPVLVVPGHADDSVTVHLGYGRTRGGHVAVGTGFDAGA